MQGDERDNKGSGGSSGGSKSRLALGLGELTLTALRLSNRSRIV